jgi:pyrroloquinoline-quinone synthase
MHAAFFHWLDHALAEHPLSASPYLLRLEDGGLTRAEFIRSQCQFHFAVRYFPRPMAALTARMPGSGLRRGLVHNLAEEHGLDDCGGSGALDPTLAHDRTFLRFLGSMGVMDSEMELEREGAGVRAFNNALMGASVMEPVAVAFGCLGVIELAFAGISARIGSAVVRRGWIGAEALVHYRLHAEIDRRHAAEFFEVVTDAWEQGGRGRVEVEDGVHLGLHIFDRLYRDLLEQAKEGQA